MEHPKFKQVIAEVIQSIQTEAQKIEPTVNLKLQASVENCLAKSSNNPDRFASCMLETQKKVSELTEGLQFKNLFLANSIQNCLNSNNDIGKCTKDGKDLIKNITSGFLKQIEKI